MFSIGFRSGDWLGHSRTWICSHSLAFLAVSIRSLSCWKIQPWSTFIVLLREGGCCPKSHSTLYNSSFETAVQALHLILLSVDLFLSHDHWFLTRPDPAWSHREKLTVILNFFHFQIIAPAVVSFSPSCLFAVQQPIPALCRSKCFVLWNHILWFSGIQF